MGKVIIGFTMSLDSFINDENGSVERLYPDLDTLRYARPLAIGSETQWKLNAAEARMVARARPPESKTPELDEPDSASSRVHEITCDC
jgi:hypothetical protein